MPQGLPSVRLYPGEGQAAVGDDVIGMSGQFGLCGTDSHPASFRQLETAGSLAGWF